MTKPDDLRAAAQRVMDAHRRGYWSPGDFDALEAALTAYVECGINGCTFSVERGEGRTMALHKSEEHAAAYVSPRPTP